MRTIATVIAVIVLAAAGLGLSCEESLNPEEIAGRYILKKVNGIDIPDFVEVSPDYQVEVLGGWWQINADETWSSRLETADTLVTNTGTYDINGLLITFADGTGFTTAGSIIENTLTIQDLGVHWYFEK